MNTKLSEELLSMQNRLLEIAKASGSLISIHAYPATKLVKETGTIRVENSKISYRYDTGIITNGLFEDLVVPAHAEICDSDDYLGRTIEMSVEEWKECVDQIGGHEE